MKMLKISAGRTGNTVEELKLQCRSATCPIPVRTLPPSMKVVSSLIFIAEADDNISLLLQRGTSSLVVV
jgi:hypothetical protein